MAKFLLVAAVAVAVTLLGGGGRGGGGFVASAHSAAIIFRDQPKMPPLVTDVKPACADKSGICEEDPEYDARIQEYVNNLLRNDRDMNALVRSPGLKNILNDVDPTVVDLSVRTIQTETETPVCSAQETLIYPKRAKTSSDNFVFVLNQEGVQQALRVEKCITDGESCSISGVLPVNAKATCRQKYVYRRMLVLGTNKIEPEEVLMPSCCVCYTTYSDLVNTRFGNNNTGHQTPPTTALPTSPHFMPGNSPPRGRAMSAASRSSSSMKFHFSSPHHSSMFRGNGGR